MTQISTGTVVLSDFMDARYGAGNWTKRTGVGAGTDAGPAMSDALNYIRTTFGRGTLIIPPGIWRVVNAPTAAQWSGNYCDGYGSQASIVVYDNNSGNPFSFSGDQGYTGGGVRGIGILLEDGYPTSFAGAIRLQGNSTYQPDQMEFRDIYASTLGNSYWYDGFFAYGVARTSPQGIRVCDASNIQMFRCRNTGFYLGNIIQWTMDNIGVYAGQGLGSNFYVAGGGSASTNSTQVYIRGLVCNELNLTNTTKFQISGSVGSFCSDTSADHGDLMLFTTNVIGSLGPHIRASYL